MAVSVLVLLAGVVVLSAATRKPCFHARTGPWHVWKAGHMTKSDGQDGAKLRVRAAHALQIAPRGFADAAPSMPLPRAQFISPTNSILVQVCKFRSPPALG